MNDYIISFYFYIWTCIFLASIKIETLWFFLFFMFSFWIAANGKLFYFSGHAGTKKVWKNTVWKKNNPFSFFSRVSCDFKMLVRISSFWILVNPVFSALSLFCWLFSFGIFYGLIIVVGWEWVELLGKDQKRKKDGYKF